MVCFLFLRVRKPRLLSTVSQSRIAFIYASIAASAAVIAIAVWWLTPDAVPPAQPSPVKAIGVQSTHSFSPTAAIAEPSQPKSPSDDDAQPAKAPPVPTITPEELVREIHQTSDPTERAQTICALVAIDTPASLAEVVRLWKNERYPNVREALIGAIAETDHDTDTAAKVALLGSALSGQARNVRRAALDGLIQFSTPAAKAYIRQAATSDPDKELRDIARELLNIAAGE